MTAAKTRSGRSSGLLAGLPFSKSTLVALLLPLVAFVLQLLFWPTLQPYVWILFYPAVFFSSWVGGLPGGLWATIISIMLINSYFIPPESSVATGHPGTILSVGVFMVMGILFSFLHGRLRKRTDQATEAMAAVQSANEMLESRVLERTGELWREITERKRAEEGPVASLDEKKALLKEVHHRVKNNLQVITSLLRLESNRIDHPITKNVLSDMQNRIQSMAMLHETLYRSGNFAQVDLDAYLRRLTDHLTRSLVTSLGQVDFRLDLFSVGLDLDQAIPCGLIVNELVSNALKHGLPAGRSGELWVELHTVGDGDLRLRVRDGGIGLPSDFEARRGKSLGLQLVSDLARQLGGKLEIGRGPGTSFEVTFTPSNHAQSGEAPKGS